MIDDFSPHLAGEIPVLDLADVQLRIPEQPRTVCFHRTHMVGVLMGDKDMVYRLRINPKPAHFFGKAVVVISRIDHNGRIAFAVEEDIRTHSRTQATFSSIQPVFKGLKISLPRYIQLIAFL